MSYYNESINELLKENKDCFVSTIPKFPFCGKIEISVINAYNKFVVAKYEYNKNNDTFYRI